MIPFDSSEKLVKMSEDDWDDTAGAPTSYHSGQSRKTKNNFQDSDSTWSSGVQMYHVGQSGPNQNGVRDSLHNSQKVAG